MSNTAKKAILHALIEGVLVELMVKTQADNVYIDDSTTLAAKLAEMVTAINLRAKCTDVTAEINQAIADLIDGAPETYDTLKELSDYIATHEDVVTAINAAIGNKADKSSVEALQTTINALGSLAKKNIVSESDLDDALKKKINDASGANHAHSNKAVLDGITADKVSKWDCKGRLLIGATKPADMLPTDLWAQIVG